MSCVMYDIQVGLRLLLIVVNRIYIYVRKVHHMSREKHCTMCGGKCIRYAQILFIFYQHLCFLTVLYMYMYSTVFVKCTAGLERLVFGGPNLNSRIKFEPRTL